MSPPIDTLDIFDATAKLPEQIATAVESVSGLERLPDPADISNVLVLGMGGSGVAGDMLTVAAGPFMPVPVVVVKNYEPPSYVDESTLVFAVSFSGNTEETLQAVTTAAAAGANIVAVTTGGKLAELATSWGAPLVPVDASIPMPRCGVGAMAIPPLLVLEEMGLFPGASEWVRLSVEQLVRRRDELVRDGSAAAQLAQRIGRTIPLIYGAGGIGGVAARRWKCQMNENPKIPAFFAEVPELCHNELAGWGQHGDMTRQVFTLIRLQHDHEHPQQTRAFEFLVEEMREVVAGVETVTADGEGSLAQLLDLVLFGDFCSVEMAFQAGVDPGPIPTLEAMKAHLKG